MRYTYVPGGALPQLKSSQLAKLVKLQSICRTYLAKKRLKETRDNKIKQLFGVAATDKVCQEFTLMGDTNRQQSADSQNNSLVQRHQSSLHQVMGRHSLLQ
jgi:hypothetical protein